MSRPTVYCNTVLLLYFGQMRLLCSADGFWANGRRLRTPVVSRRSAGVGVSFPLCSTSTSVREAMSEVIADDVAALIARMFVMTDVLAAAEVCYKHVYNHCCQLSMLSENAQYNH